MVYYSGDIHGFPYRVIAFAKKMKLTENDVIVLLGDVGANYDNGEHDKEFKESLSKIKPTVLCIHGNHEMRPTHIPTYKEKTWCNGTVWYEEEYANILFAKDGECYIIAGKKHLVLGGAYSVDKYYRLAKGYMWWADEQPSEEMKNYILRLTKGQAYDVVLSHTCPYKYIPREMFISGVDQKTVDDTTERWLDEIEEQIDYSIWYCGHWHTDKHIDKIHFLFHSFEINPQ